MTELGTGLPAPDFTLPATGGAEVSLHSLKGRKVVLFFYARDNTAGCSNEAREFRDIYPELAALGVGLLGVSRDSLASHERFSAKLELPYPLLSDSDGSVCRKYGVLKEKNMYGKKVLGVERSTFVIAAAGVVARVFRGVKAAGHAQEVLKALKLD